MIGGLPEDATDTLPRVARFPMAALRADEVAVTSITARSLMPRAFTGCFFLAPALQTMREIESGDG